MIDLRTGLDQLPDPLPIEPLSRPFDLAITPPGSKSLTCRAYVLAALARGTSRIIRPLRADDTDRLLAALCTLGADACWDDEDVSITGTNGRFPRGGEVNLGDGGAPSRFMIAAACLAAEPVVVDASPRMRDRPIAEGVDLLRRLGADIRYIDRADRLPVRITPRELSGGDLEVGATQSSQFISAVMLIAPWLGEPLTLRLGERVTSPGYVQLTRHVLRHFEGTGAAGPLAATNYAVEPDASAATYWLAAAAMVEDSSVRIDGLAASSAQADVRFARMLAEAGACATGGDPVGVRHAGPLHGVTCDMASMPDASMTLVAAISTATSPSTITGLGTLRVKETDRLAALACELTRMGCLVQTTADSIIVDPRARHDRPVTVETYHDHRMAMALAILGLSRPGISIENPACVSKSYPTFWRDFARLYD